MVDMVDSVRQANTTDLSFGWFLMVFGRAKIRRVFVEAKMGNQRNAQTEIPF